jgi:hypothetical protein
MLAETNYHFAKSKLNAIEHYQKVSNIGRFGE